MKIKIILLAGAPLILSLGIESALGQMWRLSDYSTNTWTSVASSAEGARLVAVASGG